MVLHQHTQLPQLYKTETIQQAETQHLSSMDLLRGTGIVLVLVQLAVNPLPFTRLALMVLHRRAA